MSRNSKQYWIDCDDPYKPNDLPGLGLLVPGQGRVWMLKCEKGPGLAFRNQLRIAYLEKDHARWSLLTHPVHLLLKGTEHWTWSGILALKTVAECDLVYRHAVLSFAAGVTMADWAKRARHLLRYYGISLVNYLWYGDGISWRCENLRCRKPLRPLLGWALCANTDHNHETLEIRGLLCRVCNMHADDAARVLGLAQYLIERGSYLNTFPAFGRPCLIGRADPDAIRDKNPGVVTTVTRPDDSNPHIVVEDKVELW